MEEEAKELTGAMPFHSDSVLPASDRWLRWGGLALLSSWGLCLGLANSLKVDVTVRAYGEVRPTQPSQWVVAPIAGTLETLHVNENDTVTAMQVLADLRPSDAFLEEGLATSRGLSLQRIGAPIDGTVLRLSTPNPGQPVQAGTVIAEIMPVSTDLTVKAFVPPSEVSRLVPGQSVQMQVSAYPYPEYGLLQGTIVAISPDTVACESPNCAIPYGYGVDIELQQPYLGKEAHRHDLRSGMTVTADIVTQREKLLTLILQKLRLTPNA